MDNHIESMFHDLPFHENSKTLFEKLLFSKEERHIIAQHLLDFYLKEHKDISFDNLESRDNFLNAIHLLLASFAYIVVVKEEEYFQQFCRRFIFESREDSQYIFNLKKFFISNFDPTEEYYVQYINSYQDIKKRTDALLLKYIQFFHYYL